MDLKGRQKARKLGNDELNKMGLKVVEEKDGAEGLEKLQELHEVYGDRLETELRVIISDVEMPRMDGFHFAAKVKEDARFWNVPIIFNSSISDHFSEIRGLEAGGEAYLTKFDATVFYKEVSRVIKTHLA